MLVRGGIGTYPTHACASGASRANAAKTQGNGASAFKHPGENTWFQCNGHVYHVKYEQPKGIKQNETVKSIPLGFSHFT